MITLPLWLVTTGKAVGGFLRAIPWQVYAVAALLAVGWLYGQHQYNAGVDAENARWTDAQADADAKAKAAEATRDTTATGINTAATERAHEATVETRTETAAAVERVKYVTRTIHVPVDCPVDLPDSVRDEGRAAVERAQAAGSALRAGQHP